MLSFILIAIAEASQCLPYQCSPSDYSMPTGYCAVSYNHTFFLKPCGTGLECDLTTGQCVSPPSSPLELNYPGEQCQSNTDCVSQNCTNKVCMGKSLGSSCSSHEECNPGLRCFQSTCTKQIDNTNSGCVSDYDCINSAGCNIIGSSITGICTEYLSVSIGQTVSDCSGGNSYLCKTAECASTTLFGTIGTCKYATTSVNSLPVTCSSYLDCNGFDGISYSNTNCVCGYNANGTSYCNIFDGDLYGQAYYASWQNALIASGNVCNTARRFTNSCLVATGFFNQILRATWNFYYYPLLQNNDACVRKMITYAGYEPSFSEWLVPGVVLGLILT